jgi:hypothetical protein
LDNLSGEEIAPVAEQGRVNILPNPPIAPGPVSVTMPSRSLTFVFSALIWSNIVGVVVGMVAFSGSG